MIFGPYNKWQSSSHPHCPFTTSTYVLLCLYTLSQMCCDKPCQCCACQFASYTSKLASEVVLCSITSRPRTSTIQCASLEQHIHHHDLWLTTSPDLHRSYKVACQGSGYSRTRTLKLKPATLLLYTPNQSDPFNERQISA